MGSDPHAYLFYGVIKVAPEGAYDYAKEHPMLGSDNSAPSEEVDAVALVDYEGSRQSRDDEEDDSYLDDGEDQEEEANERLEKVIWDRSLKHDDRRFDTVLMGYDGNMSTGLAVIDTLQSVTWSETSFEALNPLPNVDPAWDEQLKALLVEAKQNLSKWTTPGWYHGINYW